MKKMHALPRRTVLRGLVRGAAVAVALPPLEAMLGGNGDALADGTPIPRKFGVWFFGDGVRLERWVPQTIGPNWAASDELLPLEKAGVKKYVSVVSGTESKGHKYVHAGPASAVLTGTGLLHPDGDNGTPEGPSIDVLVAKQIGGNTPLRSIETGIYAYLGNGSAYTSISHRGPDAPNAPELDPRKVYARLFGPGSPGEKRAAGSGAVVDPTTLFRKSALDAVLGDCKALGGTLGAADRTRLEQHCDSVRDIEKRLAAAPTASAARSCPKMPPLSVTDDQRKSLYGSSLHYKELNDVSSRMLAYALACDLTHVFTHCFTNPAAHWITDALGGEKKSFHVLTHDEPGDQPTVHTGVVYTMERLADTLTIFEQTPMGAGNLLDHLAMLVTSDCSVGKSHNHRDMPVLVVGKAGGALRPNVHYRSATAESVTVVPLTLARAAGAKLESFGTGAQQVTASLAAITG